MIKKFILILNLIFCLTSCSFDSPSDIYSPIIFTEIIKTESAYDRAIEIANISNIEEDLSAYSINIYKQNNISPYQTINLFGTLDSKETFIIAHSMANESIRSKADLLIDNLMVDGTWPMSLNKGKDKVDVVGIIGYQIDYASKCDLVRKEEFFINRASFNKYDWIRYPQHETSLLGTIKTTLSENELLQGPKLSEENFNTPFIKNGLGTGGAVEVSLNYIGDGDTTTFTFPNSVVNEYVSRSESVRYLGINTPEIQHGNSIDAQPWGYEAKRYNNQVLKNAKHFAIQTAVNGTIRETYGRFLAFVWYSYEENPRPEDYILLNFEMVREALAFQYWMEPSYYDDPNVYRLLSYRSFFNNAETKAKIEGKKIHGEVDPNFDY